ncbi:hypothetical protein [Shinella sp. HZN7]|uniref:hypothetical protein n=1 Tax=Shinella sp. (strain HZN7) TaxID=879274 RepID=UPI000A67E202|nr:hypothetical protein [Shinella sp. HZN7]
MQAIDDREGAVASPAWCCGTLSRRRGYSVSANMVRLNTPHLQNMIIIYKYFANASTDARLSCCNRATLVAFRHDECRWKID